MVRSFCPLPPPVHQCSFYGYLKLLKLHMHNGKKSKQGCEIRESSLGLPAQRLSTNQLCHPCFLNCIGRTMTCDFWLVTCVLCLPWPKWAVLKQTDLVRKQIINLRNKMTCNISIVIQESHWTHCLPTFLDSIYVYNVVKFSLA